jgi:predicted RecB family nuclease
MRYLNRQLIFSPSDLIRYLASPFSSWMDRYYLEHPDLLAPDPRTEDERLVAETGDRHEAEVLAKLKQDHPLLVEVPRRDFEAARKATSDAIGAKAPIIYQAALEQERFQGYPDFLVWKEDRYEVLDAKLAQAPKPYYAIQLCCYSEMLAHCERQPMPEQFGILLGTGDVVHFRVADFLHFYRRVKRAFLGLQDRFTGELSDRPEPLPRADHGRWNSHADRFFAETDHLVQVAGISVGQIKRLKRAGIDTLAQLAAPSVHTVPKLAEETFKTLTAQAALQCKTRALGPGAPPCYEVLPHRGPNGEPVGLAALPPADPGDVFFDMEGYPLAPGGLEYLSGVCTRTATWGSFEFRDWWAHDREQEKLALESFVDWVYDRWRQHPGLHIYHYAAYEVSAIRRLSTRHDTRQEEVDALLRNCVFVDLYQVVRHGLIIGAADYSIKTVERLYREKRSGDVATASDSVVQYANWLASGQPADPGSSKLLADIRDYNKEDCVSTGQLLDWLHRVALAHQIPPKPIQPAAEREPLPDEVEARLIAAAQLRSRADNIAHILGDLVEYHRREDKPMWWRMFDRAEATPEALRDDTGCIEGLEAVGVPTPENRSLLQDYRFDPSQDCKLAVGDSVMFTFCLEAKFKIVELDLERGRLQLKIGKPSLSKYLGGAIPTCGSILQDEYVSPKAIQAALSEIAEEYLSGRLHPPLAALLSRTPPARLVSANDTSATDTAVRVVRSMSGDCLVIQGPPGTGKTYTGAQLIIGLLATRKKVGVTSNSRKAILNLLTACGEAARKTGGRLTGVMVGGAADEPVLVQNEGLTYVKDSKDGLAAYARQGGIVGGTAWLFSRPEWQGQLDFLVIDEAGQVCLANAVAMARCANNLVLLGDQMQLEQPVEGSHPGDAGLSVLQYALKDTRLSQPDAPVFHAVVPADYGLFLGQTRRMHPDVCRFISESIYEGRLQAHPDCQMQRIVIRPDSRQYVIAEYGIVFSGIEHDGNVQQSDEEIERVLAIYKELAGCPYTDRNGATRLLGLQDFLFIAPYNAQVRALQSRLPTGSRVGSVDKFQGQEAPVCVLSLCSSYGEYGSRGLGFILDRNRINVAISRAQCVAVVVADPRIAAADATSMEQMKLLNLFCRLAEHESRPVSHPVAEE